MTKNKNKKSSEAAKQEAFKLSDGICYCKTPVIVELDGLDIGSSLEKVLENL